MREANQPGMPPYVCIPEAYSPARSFYQQAAYLGANHDPLNAGGDPDYGRHAAPQLALAGDLSVRRVQDRRELQRRIGGLANRVEASAAFRAADASYQRAFELVTSARAREAFDLSREPVALREKYGRHPWGQYALLARRLVEAGVTFVTINHFDADVDWWDDHFHIERNMRRRLPLFDQALGTLIEDLHERGLGERVLVIACGEFGRSPVIDREAGRGHWARAMSALLSGGGIRTGQIIGATTANGGEPRDEPLGPGDVLATVYRVLGIDSEQSLPDRQDRPIRLVDQGRPIRGLF
jgi:hypothetical protein